MEPRLASHILVGSLIRLTEAQGGFAAVLRKGYAQAGSIVIIGRIQGQNPTLYERFSSLDAVAKWTEIPNQIFENEQILSEYLDKRTARDPDLWLLELDVASQQRLAAILGLND